MSRVLLSFYNGLNSLDRIPVFYDGLIRALERAGNQVLVLSANLFMDTAAAEVNSLSKIRNRRGFVSRILSFQPDLVVSFNHATPLELLDALSCPILVWEADSAIYFSNQGDLRKRKERYHFGIVTKSSAPLLRERFGVEPRAMHYLPFATDIRALELPQDKNISFIGSYFNRGEELIRACSEYSIEERRSVSAFLDHIERDPFAGLDDLLRLHEVPPAIARLFSRGILHNLISTNLRVELLSELADLGLTVYGNADWTYAANSSYRLALAFDPTPVYDMAQNERAYNSSRICVNVSHLQATEGLNWRIRDVMASRACLVSDRQDDLGEFAPFVEIPVYRDKYEARSLCASLLEDEGRRAEIVAGSNRAIESGHRFAHRLAAISEITGVPLAGEGPGSRTAVDPAEFGLIGEWQGTGAKRRIVEGIRALLGLLPEKTRKSVKRMLRGVAR